MKSLLALRSTERRSPIGKPVSVAKAGWNKTVPALVIAILTSDVRKPVLVAHGIGAFSSPSVSTMTPPAW
jgi:hypothetical protein